MIKAFIFDLDNCLAPASEVGEELLAPAFDAVRKANNGTVSEETLNKAFADCWRNAFDWVAATYGFSQAMFSAGWNEMVKLEVHHPMHGYGDLAALAELPVLRFLVTSGFRRLQESKLDALNIRSLFTAIYVDAIDEPDRLGKLGLFQRILDEHKFAREEVLVVGDNGESEIEAGNRLGIRTVQTLRPDVPHSGKATFYIASLQELPAIVRSA